MMNECVERPIWKALLATQLCTPRVLSQPVESHTHLFTHVIIQAIDKIVYSV